MLPSLVKKLAALCALMLAVPVAAQSAPATKPEEGLPVQELNGTVLLQAILAELAGLRDDPATSVHFYMDLARKTRDPRFAQRAAEVAAIARDLKTAGEAARLWANLQPQSTEAARFMARIDAASRNRMTETEAALVRMLADGQGNRATMLLELPRLYGALPDRAAALAAVMRLTEPYRDLAEAHIARASMQFLAGQGAEAEASARRALAIRPDNEAAILLLSQVVGADKRAAVMAELAEFGRRNPKARDARMTYGRWLLGQNRIAEASELFRKLQADFPQDDDLLFAVALLNAQGGGDAELAEAQFRSLLTKSYRPDAVNVQLGRLMAARGRFDEARKFLTAVEPGEQFSTSRIALAEMENKRGRLDVARSTLRLAVQVDPDGYEEYLLAEAQMLRLAKRFSEAQAVFAELLDKRPDQQDALYEAALLSDQMQRYDEMEMRLRHLIKLRPEGAHAYNALGYSFADRNIRLDEAEKLLRRALELAPDDAAILDSMGWLLFRQGKLPAALEHLQKAYARSKDAEISAHLGEVLWQMGRREEARRTWEESRRAQPDSEVLRNTINRLTGARN